MKFRAFLLEELTNSQKDRVDDWGETKTPVNISAHVIPKGTDRVVLPLKSPGEKTGPHPLVASHLNDNGYSISDYKAGKAKDRYDREVNIGKILNKTKASPETVKAFNSDPNRSNKTLHDDMQVVISRHPYDVAGMSTGKDWTSCLHMEKGENKHLLPHELHEGTHVAYLTRKGDDTAKSPLARIALKPYREEKTGRQILVPEHKIYGNAVGSFEHTVNEWTNEHFPLKDNTFYTKSSKVYDDSRQPVIAKAETLTDEKVKSLFEPSVNRPARESKDARALYIAKHGKSEHKQMLHNYPDNIVSMVAKYGVDRIKD